MKKILLTILFSFAIAGSASAYTFSLSPNQTEFSGNTSQITFDFQTSLNELKSLATCQGNTDNITRAILGFYDQNNWFAVDYQVNPEQSFTLTDTVLSDNLAVDCSFEPGQDGCSNPFALVLTPRDDFDTLACDPIMIDATLFNYSYANSDPIACTAPAGLMGLVGYMECTMTVYTKDLIGTYWPIFLGAALVFLLVRYFRVISWGLSKK